MNNKKNLYTEASVKELPEFHVVYVRHIGAYKDSPDVFHSLFNKLSTWASSQSLLGSKSTQFLTVYHDNPQKNSEDKLRLSICVTAPKDTKVDGDIGKMVVPGGKFAVGHFEIDTDECVDAWKTFLCEWLPQNGFQPDDNRLCYERYDSPKKSPQEKHIFDICVPVKPI